MTAKKMVRKDARKGSEEQAEHRREVRERAAEFRAGQSQVTDVAALAREAREELERRGS